MKTVYRIPKHAVLLFIVLALASASWSPAVPADAGRQAASRTAITLEASQPETPDSQAGLTADVDSPSAIGTAISFQGQLNQSGSPINGTCDFQFGLWSTESEPTQVGTTQTILNLPVVKGLFLVDNLDFGAGAFPGAPRWIGVAVRCPAGTGGYSTLTPRLAVRPAPYALYTSNSDQLDGLHSGSFLMTSGGTLNGDLSVNGLGHFYVGGGEISLSSPGGWPGLIMLSPNGHRRELKIYDDSLQLLVSSTSAAPPGTSGITIDENGYLGVGAEYPDYRLDVAGTSRTESLISTSGSTLSGGATIYGGATINGGATVYGDTSVSGLSHFYMGGGEISFTTPGGWPGMILYSPNGHRREITIKDSILQILVSSSSSPSPNESGININESGYVGIGTQSPQARLDVAGTARAQALTLTGGADLAEPFEISGANAAQPGYVVVIDEQNPGQLRLTDQPYDRKVAGCVSGAGGLQPGLVMQDLGSVADGTFPVALSGRVYCWADASFGAIQPGDLLTTSSTPGRVMLAADLSQAGGAVLGKAMSALPEGVGLVLVLVALQ